MFTIKNINSLDLIEELKREHREEFIDAIITDPPYNISRENNFECIEKKINSLINTYNLGPGNKGNIVENKENYNKLKSDFNNIKNKNSDEAIIMLFVLIIYGFNSRIRFNSKGEYNIPIGKQELNKNRLLNFKKFHSTIKTKKIDFQNLNFIDFFNLKFDEFKKMIFLFWSTLFYN